MKHIDNEIEKLKSELNSRNDLLNKIIEETTDIVYSRDNTENCISKARTFFDDRLESLHRELLSMKEKELIGRFDINVAVKKKPVEEIARAAAGLLGQIRQSHSKVEQFYEEIEVENGKLVSGLSGWKKDVYRTIDKVWLYPVSGDLDNFLLTVIVRFKVDRGDYITNSLGMRFNYIKPGSFVMGSPLEEPGRNYDEKQYFVTLSKGFYIQTTEVTRGQWRSVMGTTSRPVFKECGDSCPKVNVSWNDAQGFIRKLNQLDGSKKYRLPTEAEWEYAARAATCTRFSWGNEAACDKMMYENDLKDAEDNCVSHVQNRGLTPGATAPVMSYPANNWGLYGMHGNVWEWCQDWYGEYPSGNVGDPIGPSSGMERIVRGGSMGSYARSCRSANREMEKPQNHFSDLGFRLITRLTHYQIVLKD